MIAGLFPARRRRVSVRRPQARDVNSAMCSRTIGRRFSLAQRLRQHRLSAQAEERAARRSAAARRAAGRASRHQASISSYIPTRCPAASSSSSSILRALVVEPEILFLDEPFSALDYEMTLFMREQLQRIFLEPAPPRSWYRTIWKKRCSSPTACCSYRGVPRGSPISCRSRCAAAAHRRDPVGPRFVRIKAHCLHLPARGTALMRSRKAEPLCRRSAWSAPRDLAAR